MHAKGVFVMNLKTVFKKYLTLILTFTAIFSETFVEIYIWCAINKANMITLSQK